MAIDTQELKELMKDHLYLKLRFEMLRYDRSSDGCLYVELMFDDEVIVSDFVEIPRNE